MGDIEGGPTFATVDDNTDGDRLGTVEAAGLDGFDNASAAGDDILHDEHFFARLEGKITAQGEFVVDFFEENKTEPQLAGHFLADDEAAHGGSDDGGGTVVFELVHHNFREARNFVHILAHLGALEKVGAVQTGAKQEVPFEQGSAVFEDLNDLVGWGFHILECERIGRGGKFGAGEMGVWRGSNPIRRRARQTSRLDMFLAGWKLGRSTMLNLLHRYILKEILIATGLAMGLFVFVLLMGNVIRDVAELVAGGKLGVGIFFKLVGLLLPYVAAYALPLGVLTGTLMALGRLSSNREITAMKSVGVGLYQIASPVFLVAFLGMLAGVLVNLHFAGKAFFAGRKRRAEL